MRGSLYPGTVIMWAIVEAGCILIAIWYALPIFGRVILYMIVRCGSSGTGESFAEFFRA